MCIKTPFTEKIAEFLACIETIFHIMVKNIKSIVLLSLGKSNFSRTSVQLKNRKKTRLPTAKISMTKLTQTYMHKLWSH